MYIPPNNPNPNPNPKKTTRAVIIFLVIFLFMFGFPFFAILDSVFMAGDGFFFIIPFIIIPIVMVLGIVSVIVKILKSAKTGFQNPIDLNANSKEQNPNQEGSAPGETSTPSTPNTISSRISSFMGLTENSIIEMEKKITQLDQENKTPSGLSNPGENKQEPIPPTVPHSYERTEPVVKHSYDTNTGEKIQSSSTRMITCSGCRKKIREDARYCDYCGEPTTKLCPVCQRENTRSNRYCTYCKSRM